jgi:hypothetical protein
LIRQLSKDVLHEILSSPLLELESEDAFLRTLIDLGRDYLEFWDYIELRCLTKNGISVFLDTFEFDNLTISIWTQIVERLKSQPAEPDLIPGRHCARLDSVITVTSPAILHEIGTPMVIVPFIAVFRIIQRTASKSS